MNKWGYLDVDSIEFELMRGADGGQRGVWSAWYCDQDGGEIGIHEIEGSADEEPAFPEMMDF